MAKKPSINNITTGYTSAEAINENFQNVRDAFDNTLSLDGSTPNAMNADLDMNGNSIINADTILVGGTDYLAQALAYRNAAQAAQTGAETAETNAEAAEAAALVSETNAASSASSASTSETNAAASETASASSASAAALSASSASVSASSASTSASNASTSESNAATSASNAASSASSASSSASSASTSASNAAASEAAAAASESNAATSESNAATSASAASTSETNAATSASNAATSATNAATSETNAASSASSASTSASNAATSETNAATSASNAASSATASAGSATSAASSASSAQASADAALSALDNFDDRYLGQKTSDPTLDNDGNALVTGALYFNTTDNTMKVYDGSQWLAAYASLSGALLATNNLSDLNDAPTARTNLGLGTAATTASTDYATAAQGTNADTAYGWGNHASAGYLTSYTETDPIYTASSWYTTTNNSSNWNTAYGWGNHASAGYLTDITGESIQALSDVATMSPTEGQALVYSSGSWTAADMSGGIAYTRKTANYTASANEGIIADTSGGSFTVTLPASPATGDTVMVVDGNDWSTTNLIVGRNGSTIEGDAADLTCDVGAVAIQFTYDGTTWQIYAQAGSYGANLSAYLPLSGGTLTGALSGTTLTLTGALSGTNLTMTGITDVDEFTVNSSAGTSGQLLTSNGSGLAPTWQDAASAGWEYVSTTTISGSPTSVVWTGLDMSTYDYCLLLENIGAQYDTPMLLDFSTNNGSTYIARTSSNYGKSRYTTLNSVTNTFLNVAASTKLYGQIFIENISSAIATTANVVETVAGQAHGSVATLVCNADSVNAIKFFSEYSYVFDNTGSIKLLRQPRKPAS